MESNGKRVTRDGEEVDYATGPVVWGEPGTNGQHAFYQLIASGNATDPGGFPRTGRQPQSHRQSSRNPSVEFLAQTEALMRGKTEAEARQELQGAGHEGGAARASTAAQSVSREPADQFCSDKLTPRTLGAR